MHEEEDDPVESCYDCSRGDDSDWEMAVAVISTLVFSVLLGGITLLAIRHHNNSKSSCQKPFTNYLHFY